MSFAFPSEIEIAPATPPDGQSGDAAGRALLSLVIPVRDAAGSLPATLNAITRWMSASNAGVEVVIVDDGSTDGTRATASSFERRIANLQVLRHVDRRGWMDAIRTGEQAASGELIAFGPSHDLGDSLDACPDLLSALIDGSDVAVLPAAPDRRITPIPIASTRSIADSCVDWIRSKMVRAIRDPALVLASAVALRRMLTAARPDEGEPDWCSLARRAHCDVRVLRRGRPSARPRLLPAPTG